MKTRLAGMVLTVALASSRAGPAGAQTNATAGSDGAMEWGRRLAVALVFLKR